MGFRPINDDIRIINTVDKIFRDSNNTAYLIRGNHDNPCYWGLQFGLKNIIFAKDHDVYELEGKRILCVGGAISVDRMDRRIGMTYWENEAPTYRKPKYKTIDVVISHDAPICVNITHPYYSNDESLKTDMWESRKILQQIDDEIGFQQWIFGHHHTSTYNQIGEKIYRGLDINEIYEIRDMQNGF
jgi:predicted phosphodiesterase